MLFTSDELKALVYNVKYKNSRRFETLNFANRLS